MKWMPLQDVKPGDENERETVGGRCMFCHRDLGDAGGVMLAWWMRLATGKIVKAGAYHNGRVSEWCQDRAIHAVDGGHLLDVHAGDVDAQEVDRILAGYRDWEPDALRAFVLAVLAMKRVA